MTDITQRPLGKHMVAFQHADHPDVWVIKSKHGDVLGGIEYYPSWRQYEFFPAESTMFSWDCLQALSAFLQELSAKRRGK